MALLEIDGLNLHPHLRTQEGDGFQPMDGDKLAPQFAEGGLTEGQPLISFNEDNGEWIIPLHLNPGKAGFANTRQGLNDLQQEVVRRLRAAKTLAWQDAGVDQPTFYDVEFARLEPEYRFWRAQKLYLSCTVRAWTKPYGHTGTYRTVATAARPLSAMAVLPLPSLIGDADAQLHVRTSVGTVHHYNGTVTAANQETGNVMVSVVPGGFRVPHGPSEIARDAAAAIPGLYSGTIVGVAGAVASTVWRSSFVGGGRVAVRHLSTSEIDDVPQRVFALLRVAGTPVGSVSVLGYAGLSVTGFVLGPNTFVSKAGNQWSLVDLGRLHVRERQHGPTTTISVTAQRVDSVATTSIDVTEMYVVPEDSTVLVRESAFASLTAATLPYLATSVIDSVDGPRVDLAVGIPYGGLPLANNQRGRVPHVPPGDAQSVAVLNVRTGGMAAVGRTVSAEVQVRERFTFAR